MTIDPNAQAFPSERGRVPQIDGTNDQEGNGHAHGLTKRELLAAMYKVPTDTEGDFYGFTKSTIASVTGFPYPEVSPVEEDKDRWAARLEWTIKAHAALKVIAADALIAVLNAEPPPC